MKKIRTLLLLALLFFNAQAIMATEDKTDANAQASFEKAVKEYDFENNSHYISDEQLEEAKQIDKIDNNTSFWSRVRNSSHFSSDTATKTYIPINKVQD